PEERIHAERQAEGRRGKVGREALERVDRIRRAGPVELAPVDDEPRLVGHRRLEHREAQRGRSLWSGPVRRAGSRYESDLAEPGSFEQLERDAKMADVDRVERAAEHPDEAAAVSMRERHAACGLRARPGSSIATTSRVTASHGGRPGAPLTTASSSTAWPSRASRPAKSKRFSARSSSARRFGQTRWRAYTP